MDNQTLERRLKAKDKLIAELLEKAEAVIADAYITDFRATFSEWDDTVIVIRELAEAIRKAKRRIA